MKLHPATEVVVAAAMEGFAEAAKAMPDPSDEQAFGVIDYLGALAFKNAANATNDLGQARLAGCRLRPLILNDFLSRYVAVRNQGNQQVGFHVSC